MKEHPILFNSEMARAVLEGRKTQTRRVIKNPERLDWLMLDSEASGLCPYGQVGDLLWVKENYQILRTWYKKKAVEGVYINDDPTQVDDSFNADGKAIRLSDKEWDRYSKRKWPHRKTPALFMYKSLARFWYKITNIRVERVQDITPEDILEEGLCGLGWDYAESSDGTGDMFMYWDEPTKEMPDWCPRSTSSCECIEDVWRWFWDSINEKRGYGWSENPYVWVIEFKRIER